VYPIYSLAFSGPSEGLVCDLSFKADLLRGNPWQGLMFKGWQRRVSTTLTRHIDRSDDSLHSFRLPPLSCSWDM